MVGGGNEIRAQLLCRFLKEAVAEGACGILKGCSRLFGKGSYLSSAEGKFKLTEEEYKEKYGDEDDGSGELITFFGENDFEEFDIYLNPETGEREIYFALKESTFPIVFSEHMESMKELIAGESEITSCKVVSPELIMAVNKEGKLSAYALAYTLELTLDAEGTSVPVSAYIYDEAVINKTENVNVPVPGGLDSYVGSAENA